MPLGYSSLTNQGSYLDLTSVMNSTPLQTPASPAFDTPRSLPRYPQTDQMRKSQNKENENYGTSLSFHENFFVFFFFTLVLIQIHKQVQEKCYNH